jgi:hypothetical protein
MWLLAIGMFFLKKYKLLKSFAHFSIGMFVIDL